MRTALQSTPLILIGLISAVLLVCTDMREPKPFYLDVLPFSAWPTDVIVEEKAYTGMSLRHGENEYLAPFIFWEGTLGDSNFFTPILDNQNRRYTFERGSETVVLQRYSIYFYDLKKEELIQLRSSIEPELFHNYENLKKLAIEAISAYLKQSSQ